MKNKVDFKRIISMTTALMIAASMVSCGSSDESGGGEARNDAVVKSDEGKTPAAEGHGDADTGKAETEAAADMDTADEGYAEYGYDGETDEAEGFGLFDGVTKDEAATAKSSALTTDGAMEPYPSTGGGGDIAAAGTTGDGLGVTNGEPDIDLPEAGQLTAGEWNDNDNWGFFINLVNSGAIKFPSFGIDPTDRTTVTVKNSSGEPVVNAKVKLLNGTTEEWYSVTDKNGVAYLFGEGDKVEVASDGTSNSYDVVAASGDEQSGEVKSSRDIEVTFDSDGKLYKDMEVMFIVDTTGSMSDEMLFLQSEFSAITRAVGTENTKYSVNFYRDEGDDYVTKCFGFSDDVSDIQKTLNAQNADGGGDFPEAVAEIMEETITNGEWSDETVKLAFMIFDAPPHDDTDSLEKLDKAVKAASEKGIRLIPVVSSNSDRDTELFARALGICTGGSYVFLTDDSGIGGSHLEPIIGDYEVEKLYDIIIRIIGEYRQ